MLRKKLLTLACVLGILACGACFGPIYSPPAPPPPPLRTDVHGIHTIRVTVSSPSESHPLDPATLAEAVVDKVNWQAGVTGIHAHVQEEAGNEDALMEVKVISESVHSSESPSPAGTRKWTFDFKLSATLTRQDGEVVWRETNRDYSFFDYLATDNPADLWDNPPVRIHVTSVLSLRLVQHMLYGDKGGAYGAAAPLQ